MSAEQLWDTTLNPETRRLLRVQVGQTGVEATTDIFNRLMGKGEVPRRAAS